MEIIIITVCIIFISILIYGSTYINMLDKNKVTGLTKYLKNIVKDPGGVNITTELSVTILEFIISGIVVEKYGVPLVSSLANKFSYITFNSIKYITILIVTIIATYITMILGTYIPKHLVLIRKSKKINKIALYIFAITSTILLPLSFVATILDRSYHKRKDKIEDELYRRDEIKHFTNVEYHKGSINKIEKDIIEKATTSFDVKVSKIMTPIDKVAFIKINYSFLTIMKTFKKSTYSRLVVYNDNKTKILGALYVKDVLHNYEDIKSGKINIEDILRKPLEISHEDTAYKIYMKMRKNKMHLATIKNDDDIIIGILTLDDILEEILGKIGDEYSS